MNRWAIRYSLFPLLIPIASIAVVAPLAVAVAPTPASTLGAEPPDGAIVLFDGSNLDAWESQMNRHWEKSDGPADWRITPEGWLEVVPGAGSLISKNRFGDCRMHLEYRLPAGDVNGGVFILARYELGISSSQDGGPKCGAFDNLVDKTPPLERTDLGPSQWQSIDVDFRAPRFDSDGAVVENARAIVLLNGVTIHENVELGTRKGAAKRLGDAPEGPMMLQEHGSTYQFRNIWVTQPAKANDQ